MVKTIPKGTLLFRLVKHPEDDTRGVPIGEGKRCIIPNHNVFFYPNPFVGKIGLGIWIKDETKIRVYILKHDVKVLWLLTPSPYARVSKNTKRNFIKRCSKVPSGCLPPKPTGILAAYNPCVSETIIKKYPDVVGMIALAFGDSIRINEGYRKKTIKKNRKYFYFANDAIGTHSIPELILHPLRTRPSEDLIVEDTTKLDTNFELLKTLSLKDEEKVRSFMDNHALYNPETYFYTYKE